jgi:nucleotide-binding universal stress UspA family protein
MCIQRGRNRRGTQQGFPGCVFGAFADFPVVPTTDDPDEERRETMYNIVLWATDGSSGADGALVEAKKMLEPGGELIAFHCDERFASGRAGGAPLMADEFDCVGKLRAQVEQLKTDGIDAKLVIRVTHHHAVGEIATAAEEYGADAIVCGTRGLGVVAGVVAGSVAMRLPHVAPCPVLVVSEKAAERKQLVAV